MRQKCFCLLIFFALIGCGKPEEKARTLFNQAQALEREGKSAEAKQLLERVVKEYPQTQVATEANQALDRGNLASTITGALGNALIKANQGSAVASMRTIGSGWLLYRSTKGTGPLSLKEMLDDDILSPELASGIRSGYRFTFKPGKDPSLEFSATAQPLEPGKTGRRSYYVDEMQVVRFSESGPATSSSPQHGVGIE